MKIDYRRLRWGIESEIWIWYKIIIMGLMGTERDPRVVLIGDITGIPAKIVNQFLTTAGHPPYGGSFPNCHDQQTTAVVQATQTILTEAGIADPSPITPCDSPEEEILQILLSPELLKRQGEAGRPVIILDQHPDSLVRAAACFPRDLTSASLQHVTVINLGPGEPSDRVDPNTGIRVVTLPPYCYPIHPTLAS